MGFDETVQERQRLLEEIQRRAEEAELARIEAEEARFTQTLSAATFLPLDEQESDVQTILHASEVAEQDGRAQEAFLPLYQKPANDRPANGQHDAEYKQRVAELLESAHRHYEQEDYEAALRDLDELTALDEHHGEATAFRGDVERANSITQRLREEEQRRKSEESDDQRSSFVIPPPPVAVPETPSSGFDEQPAHKKELRAPKVPPPVRAARRKGAARRLFMYVVVGVLLLLGAITTFVVYDHVRGEYFPPSANLLLLPPTSSNFDARLAAGLAEDLALQLSHLRSINVMVVRPVLGEGGWTDAIQQASLPADAILEWDVKEENGIVTASLSIVRTATSARVLERTLQFPDEKLAEMVGEAASSIAHALDVDAGDMQSEFMTTTMNKEAYDWYLLGRSFMHDGNTVSLDSIAVLFDCARQADPKHPYAEAAFGWANVLLHATLTDTASAYLDQAARSLKRAVSLGGTSAEVYRLWGVIEFFQADYHRAILRLENAQKLAPSDAETQQWLALGYLRVGRKEEALRAGQAAVRSDAAARANHTLLGMIYLANSDYKNALERFETAARLAPDSSGRYPDAYFGALVGLNQHERAIDMLRRRVHDRPRDFVALYDLARMYQLAGKPRVDWEATLRQSLHLIEDTLKTNPAFGPAYSYRGLAQTRLGLFQEGIKSNILAMERSPDDVAVLYNAARIYALQHNKSGEATALLLQALNRRFSPDRFLDLDLAKPRNDPAFAQNTAK